LPVSTAEQFGQADVESCVNLNRVKKLYQFAGRSVALIAITVSLSVWADDATTAETKNAPPNLVPGPNDGRIAYVSARMLEANHYRQMSFDDHVSEKFYEGYLDVLKQAGSPERRVAPVLLANAGSHAETIDQAARAFRAREAAGCILTKLDEATRIGGALDNALRYKLRVLGVTHGQRVPEDWRVPDSRLLAELALAPAGQFFTLEDDEGSLLANDAVAARG